MLLYAIAKWSSLTPVENRGAFDQQAWWLNKWYNYILMKRYSFVQRRQTKKPRLTPTPPVRARPARLRARGAEKNQRLHIFKLELRLRRTRWLRGPEVVRLQTRSCWKKKKKASKQINKERKKEEIRDSFPLRLSRAIQVIRITFNQWLPTGKKLWWRMKMKQKKKGRKQQQKPVVRQRFRQCLKRIRLAITPQTSSMFAWHVHQIWHCNKKVMTGNV